MNKVNINPDFSYIEIKYPEEAMNPPHAVFVSWDKAALFINESVYTYSLSSGTFDRVITSDKISPVRLFNYKGIISFVSMADNKLYTVNDVSAWNHSAEPIGDIKYHIGVYLEKVSYLVEYSTMALYAFQGINNTISAIYENATAEADGLMSKEDKIKLNSVMKFPDGEAGCTLPDAAGRADKLITFSSSGEVELHSTHDYDKWRNVRISTTEPTVGLNLELPNPTERANKVVGFNADGKSIEMKTAGGGADITVGQGLQKNGNEISLKSAKPSGELGGIYLAGDMDEPLRVNEYGRLTLRVEEGIYVKHYEYDRSLALQKATASDLGGIKVGSGLSINSDGVLSAEGGGGGAKEELPFIAGTGMRITSCDWSYSLLDPKADFVDIIYWPEKKIHIAAEGVNLWYSRDLKVWSKCVIRGDNTKKINCLIAEGDKAYAGGDLGLLMSSSDGIDWEIIKSGTAYGMKGIVIKDGRLFFLDTSAIYEKVPEGLVQSFVNPNGGVFTGIKKLLDGSVYAYGENGTIVSYDNGTWKLVYEARDTIIKDMMFQNNEGTTFALQNRLSSGTAVLWRSSADGWSVYTSNSSAMSMNSFCDKNTGYKILLYIGGAEGKMYSRDILNQGSEWEELPRLSSNINKVYNSNYTPLTIAGHQTIYKEGKSVMISVKE